MTKFIENINEYLNVTKIKQTYICKKSGLDFQKLSDILTGAQVLTNNDMAKIALALGKEAEFFESENIFDYADDSFIPSQINYNDYSLTAKQKNLTKQIFYFMENIDAVLSAKARFEQSL